MNNEKFLPIGSVVMLKGGTKPTMITSYCIIPKGDIYDKNGPVDKTKITYYDYGACLYPEGVVRTNKTFVFNHDQIDRVLYMGYTSSKYINYNNALCEVATTIDAQKDKALEEKELTKVHVDIPVLNI